MNKKNFNVFAFAMALLILAVFAGCEKNDKDDTFGTPVIYMPQAALANLNYAVPSGRDSSNFNYKIDAVSNKVNIILGVNRSGSVQADGYSVNIGANADTVNQLIANKILDPAKTVLLPSSIYTLPSSLTVPSGQNGATFYLSVDKTQLKTYAGKKAALGVVISGASKNTVSTTLNKVVVIIDVDALKL